MHELSFYVDFIYTFKTSPFLPILKVLVPTYQLCYSLTRPLTFLRVKLNNFIPLKLHNPMNILGGREEIKIKFQILFN